ncbi:DUF6973 domain-containing protein [Candidatus Margulisiibacteriota bacterium]
MIKQTIKYVKNICELKKKEYVELKEECTQEAYEYFDKHIRKLPKNPDGTFNEASGKMHNNDADAFRHAYTAGVFTLVHGSLISNLAGLYNELTGNNPINQQNMDLWNNAVGRKYGEKATSKNEIANNIKKSLEKGELITNPDDPREYKGLRHFNYDPQKPVKVIQESETGRNQYFLDLSNGNIMDRENFVSAIESGQYPGYQLAQINSIITPISKPDDSAENNLG